MQSRRAPCGACELVCGLLVLLTCCLGYVNYMRDVTYYTDQHEAAMTSFMRNAHTETDDCTTGELGFLCESCIGDSPCSRLYQKIMSRSASTVRAAIYVLVGSYSGSLTRMLTSVYTNFNHRHRYPFIVFHEPGFNRSIATQSSVWRDVWFQEIQFIDPSFVLEPRTTCPGARKGYAHMCRFNARLVYEHPLIRDLDYVLRLDDDSLILGPEVHYDLFEFMKTNHMQYGYRSLYMSSAQCVQFLYANISAYIKQRTITPVFYQAFRNTIFYNNFELSSVRFFRGTRYSDFFNYLDMTGGVFAYRWGDAQIKTYGLSLFGNISRIHHFTDFGYEHQDFNLPKEEELTFLEYLNGVYKARKNRKGKLRGD